MQEIVKVGNSSIRLYGQPADMRLGFPGMLDKIKNDSGQPAQKDTAYIFVNKSYQRVKILFWDRNGWVMYYKFVHGPSPFKFENRKGYRAISAVNVKELLKPKSAEKIKVN